MKLSVISVVAAVSFLVHTGLHHMHYHTYKYPVTEMYLATYDNAATRTSSRLFINV